MYRAVFKHGLPALREGGRKTMMIIMIIIIIIIMIMIMIIELILNIA